MTTTELVVPMLALMLACTSTQFGLASRSSSVGAAPEDSTSTVEELFIDGDPDTPPGHGSPGSEPGARKIP